ncbi:MAG: family B DNA polymerase, partial [Tannerellaceae bacterium]
IGQEADAVADVVSYLAVQNIAHMMARMSTNIGVDEMHKFRYAMKNEYKFASFALTNKAKHYFSLITSQEGTLSEDPELEVKGVALRTSNIPPVIMQEFRNTIKQMSFEVMNGRPIELFPLLRKVADIEESIIKSVHEGDYMYLKTGQVKTKEGYTKPESSNYHYYEMWEEVFAGKYGNVGIPPYDVVKVSVDLDNKTLMRRWIDGIEDRALAARLSAWLLRHGRTYNQLLLPEALLGNGIPKEILDVVDYRRIIFASVEPYYHILESLGVYTIDKNRTRLLSDYYGQSVLDQYKEAA